MISLLEFFGGQTSLSTAVDATLDFRFRVWLVTATTTSRTIFMPPTTIAAMPVGGPVLIIVNVGANSFSVRDTELLDPIYSLTTGKAAVVSSSFSGSAKRWSPLFLNYYGSP